MIATKPQSPYKGLVPFEDSELDALLFFGREREGQIISANVLAARLTVLYGPSGVGKTSVLRAGVAYRLRQMAQGNVEQRGHPEFVVVVFDAWSNDPVTGLREAAHEALGAQFGSALLDAREGESLADTLARWTDALACDLLFVLDQAEEYFLYHADESEFADELPELVTRPGLRVRVLLALRDDALAKLDRFKGRIPNLFANYLRLDHLDRRSARDAIVKPVERFNDLGQGDPVEVEPALIGAVLSQTAAGKVDLGDAGRGLAPGETDESRIEAPYLQLVMERVWEEEGAQGSRVLRAQTLERLGGAQAIVRTHLRRAVDGLTPAERDVAADVFRYLVTPSGTKIAHGAGDLAEYASVDERRLRPVLATLGRERILRPIDGDGTNGARYEIFHDVLADAVLGWRREQELERERRAARRRQRRLAAVAIAAVLALALMTAVAAYAFSQREEAQKQAASAESQRTLADKSAALASSKEIEAREAERDAERAAALATEKENEAKQDKAAAEEATKEADSQKQAAQEAEQRATDAADVAQSNEEAATQSKAVAERERTRALEAQKDAEAQKTKADRSAKDAQAQSKKASASALVARSLAVLPTNPQKSLEHAVAASSLDPSAAAEDALRAALASVRLLHILPGTGARPAGSVDVRAFSRFSSDGSVVVVGGGSPEVRMFRVRDGALVRRFRPGGAVNDAALSPDGRLLAVGSGDRRAYIWDAASGDLLRRISNEGPAGNVVWSPNGQLLAVTSVREPAARLWNAADGTHLRTHDHPEPIRSATFSADGSLLATASDDAARVFQVATGQSLPPLEHSGRVTSAAFSPAGDLIVTGARDRTARVWDARTGEPRWTFPDPGQVLDVAFAPDGERVAVVGTDATLRLLNARTGVVENAVGGHREQINHVEFGPASGSVLTASDDGTARISRPGQQQTVLIGHTAPVASASFSSDGRTVVTAGTDRTARLWEPYGEPELAVLGRHQGPVTSVAFETAGTRLASASADATVRVQSANGQVIRTLSLGRPVVTVGWARGGVLFAATDDGEGRIWSDGGGRLLRTFAHGSPIRAAALSPDGKLAATAGEDRKVRLWNAETGAPGRVVAHAAPVTAVAIDPTGKLLASASGRRVRAWRVANGRLIKEFVGHTDTVTGVAFGPGGRLLATSSEDKDARLWDVEKRRASTPAIFHGHSALVSGVAVSTDGRWVATAGPLKAGIWEVGSSDLPSHLLFFLTGNEAPVSSVAFSARRWRLLTGGRDGSVRTYTCSLCGGLRELVPLAKAKLNRFKTQQKRFGA